MEISERVLCVDDQPDLLFLLSEQLDVAYPVDTAESGQEALRKVMHDGPYAVVICDYQMPGMNGISLLSEIKQRSPHTVFIMLTGFEDVQILVSALHETGIYRFIHKPWDPRLLRRYVEAAMDQYRAMVTHTQLTEALHKANERLQGKIEDLEAANSMLRRWVRFSPSVLYSARYDANQYRPTYVSANITKVTGWDASIILENSDFWVELVHPEDLQILKRCIQQTAESAERRGKCEYRVKNADDQYIWVLDHFHIELDASGGSEVEVIGSWTDNSRLKTTEQALEESQNRLREMSETEIGGAISRLSS